ncbi:MAG: hypothetical protein AAF192_23545 [Pseudomonadota bacterium]
MLGAATLSAAAGPARAVDLAEAQAPPVWGSDYMTSGADDRLTICRADIEYPNALFGLRLHGPDMTAELYFAHDGFAMPHGARLGRAELRIGEARHRLDASTFPREAEDGPTTNFMLLRPRRTEAGAIVNRLRDPGPEGAGAVAVALPRQSFDISLARSAEAIDAALACWRRNYTGPRPGVGG